MLANSGTRFAILGVDLMDSGVESGVEVFWYGVARQRYNKVAMKLEIEVNVADNPAIRAGLQEHLRKEAVLALFADRQIPAGQAALELGLTRIAFMGLLQQRGIPYVDYTAED